MKAVDLLKSKVSGHMGMLMTPDLSRLIMDVRYELGKRNIEILDLIETAFIGHQRGGGNQQLGRFPQAV